DQNRPKVWEGDWIANYAYGTGEAVDALLKTLELGNDCWSLEESTPYLNWLASVRVEGGWGERNDSYSQKKASQRKYLSAKHPSVLQTSYALAPFLRFEKYSRAQSGQASSYISLIEEALTYMSDQA